MRYHWEFVDTASWRVNWATLGHTLVTLWSNPQFFRFFPRSVHVLQISFDDVPVPPLFFRLSLVTSHFPLRSLTSCIMLCKLKVWLIFYLVTCSYIMLFCQFSSMYTHHSANLQQSCHYRYHQHRCANGCLRSSAICTWPPDSRRLSTGAAVDLERHLKVT